ncbi:translocation and assembly module lipoprotein TamL [Ulvibacter litoralis]|uniref:Outer membrane protein assembly factor BamA n=1 Tax=Ulvibacter litoralis TaxID=227084 RepID=A0A1G7GG33_9FLAO|nr:BamA/TamA family outer membrane protein [Ulvibacter litoralis]GHC56339.1 membrane protein [Ulvibacter litoralis]SDE87094.1 Outer membrane protein assembly factor BamA [Ulvibacter litoralis]
MTQTFTKISLILGLIALLISCNAVKRVPDDKFLLTDNTIVVDEEEINDAGVFSQLIQKPNPKIPLVNVPMGLHIYNLADPQPDSTFTKWLYKKPKREERLVRFLSKKQVDQIGNSYVGLNKWLEKSGDAPVVIDDSKAKKSLERIKQWYSKRGWFNTKGSYGVKIDSTKKKRATITYNIQRFKPYYLDSIQEKISSKVVDSLFQDTKDKSFVIEGKQYAAADFNNERDRLTIQFRNSGLYHFDQDYIGFEADTINTGHKANITYLIPDRKITVGDSTRTEPFKIHKINEVRIITDYSFANKDRKFSDSATYNGYTLFSYDKLRFKPKAITDAVSITPGQIFRDIDRTLTYNQISDLRIFKYPNINYQEDPRDSTGTGLISTVLLSPRKKATLETDFDTYTSIIQQIGVGFSASVILRNVFRRAEILEISGRGSIGSSKDANDSERFFNISDVGGDIKLSFPRIVFPVNTNKIIPKYMSPSTSISLGINAQNNIGLDRQNFNAIFSYQWKPSKIRTNKLDLLNIQYVRNLNTANYFNVYVSSFDRLNEIAVANDYTFQNEDTQVLEIPDETSLFITEALDDSNPLSLDTDEIDDVSSIKEREERLTEDNLIFATNFTWTRDTREGILDNSFSRLQWKIEGAGNILSGIANLAGLTKNDNGNYETLGIVFSQYIKLEGNYIKHWEINSNSVFAVRTFAGVAIPYGNSTSIPFTRSYFAGGANDNRGWRAYDLGPGSSGSIQDFNEANLKIALNAEYRYTILGDFKGAFFVDAGNIWNVADNITDESSRFTSFSDLSEIAIASGLGIRYDFGFFVFRFDVGFKTYNPALTEGERWFKEYNFGNAVYNIGINYPF